MDMTESIAPKSDQINADDLVGNPIIVTITDVRKGSAEQPVDVIVAEYPGRAYRPSKTMRKMIVAAWGTDTAAYIGRQLKLFRNPEITFGRDKVGGIEIEALSHIDKALSVALTTTRGKRKMFTVQPLATTQPPAPTEPHDWLLDAVNAGGDIDALRGIYTQAQKSGADQTILDQIKEMATP